MNIRSSDRLGATFFIAKLIKKFPRRERFFACSPSNESKYVDVQLEQLLVFMRVSC